MDFELDVLSINKELFEKKKIKVVVSESKFIKSCLNKLNFYKFCVKNSINTPKIYLNFDKKNRSKLIMKEIRGSGSNNQSIVNKKNLLKLPNGYFLQKYIYGEEYGMDILNSFNGEYVHSFTRKKLLMKNGETDQAIVVREKRFNDLAKKISKITKHIGNLDIDFLVTNKNKILILDFNPRFGGGYPLTHLSGFNYIEYLIESAKDKKYNFKYKNNKNNLILSKGISTFIRKI